MTDKASGMPLQFDGKISAGVIHRFADISSIRTLQVPEIEYVVPALVIPTKAVVLWCGPDGAGKTFLAEAMSLCVARGDDFLGMPCLQRPVLYLDFEKPAHTVMDRFNNCLFRDDEDPPLLKIWGVWEKQPPPRSGSRLLIEIVREVHPLVVVDTFRSFHDAKENESDGMACVMTYLRALAEYGATALLLHHPSKTEGSNGRGSSVIHASCDVALMHTLNDGLITLKIEKNRNGASRTLTVRADFEQGSFEVTNSPFVTQRNDELDKLEKVIRENPGESQNRVCALAGMNRDRARDLLKQNVGKRWTTDAGPNRRTRYYPNPNPNRVGLDFPDPLGPTEPLDASVSGQVGGSGGSPLRGEEPPNHHTTGNHSVGTHWEPPDKPNGRTLPACPTCGSTCLYREPDGTSTCQTCENRIQ